MNESNFVKIIQRTFIKRLLGFKFKTASNDKIGERERRYQLEKTGLFENRVQVSNLQGLQCSNSNDLF